MSSLWEKVNLSRLDFDLYSSLKEKIEASTSGDRQALIDCIGSLRLQPTERDQKELRSLAPWGDDAAADACSLVARLRSDPSAHAQRAVELVMGKLWFLRHRLLQLACVGPGSDFEKWGDVEEHPHQLLASASAGFRQAYVSRLYEAEPELPLVLELPWLEQMLGGLDPEEDLLPQRKVDHAPRVVQSLVRDAVAFASSYEHPVVPRAPWDSPEQVEAAFGLFRARFYELSLSREDFVERILPLDAFADHYDRVLFSLLGADREDEEERDRYSVKESLLRILILYADSARNGWGVAVRWCAE